MKKVLSVRWMLFNSFLVVLFAACGVNGDKKAEICSHLDSEMFVAENKFAKNKTEDNSHPMLLPNNHNLDTNSHPMVISPCSKSEE